ncbi:C2 domain-containing protein 3-like [Catharus ustulatus]|uniref:C2 domain-containing protein 3-like n=1 Tax=Catharus ustulatus TaxID=91951 RepID=UPI00140B5442|nr:C2 domain-containing protein 3-like [Catharus ustulatus]
MLGFIHPAAAVTEQKKLELGEVQRYFSEKLTRSFPDFSTSRPSHEECESDPQGLMSREVDPKGCHLLEKSSQLVSQVSSLINGDGSLHDTAQHFLSSLCISRGIKIKWRGLLERYLVMVL